jgi:hypothetical protein
MLSLNIKWTMKNTCEGIVRSFTGADDTGGASVRFVRRA